MRDRQCDDLRDNRHAATSGRYLAAIADVHPRQTPKKVIFFVME